MNLIIASLVVFSAFAGGKSWDCKYFNKPGKEYFKHGPCALNIYHEQGKTYLLILMPLKKDLNQTIPLRLDLLNEGKSYTDKNGRGHWSWNKNTDKMTLYGSLGDNGTTPHCWLKNGKLTLIDKGK